MRIVAPMLFASGTVQVFHKVGVRPSVLSDARRNALDPHLFVFATLALAVPVRVLPALFDATDGNAVTVLGATPKALGVCQKALVLKQFNTIHSIDSCQLE